MPTVLTIQGPLFGYKFSIWEELTFGRQQAAMVCIPDNQASRMHAVIQNTGTRYVLVDLSSRNGTYLNGKRISSEKHQLFSGDIIQIGESKFIFDIKDINLKARYDASWVFLCKNSTTESAIHERYHNSEINSLPSSNTFLSHIFQDFSLIQSMIKATIYEKDVYTTFLSAVVNRLSATAGILFSFMPDGEPTPLVLYDKKKEDELNSSNSSTSDSNNSKNDTSNSKIDTKYPSYFSIPAEIFEDCKNGFFSHYRGSLILTDFDDGTYKAIYPNKEILTAPWFINDRVAGLLWLERSLGESFYRTADYAYISQILDISKHIFETTRILNISKTFQQTNLSMEYGITGNQLLYYFNLIDNASRLAKSKESLTIVGPPGSGLTRVARAIHAMSLRSYGPCISFSCVNLNEELMKQELFGVLPGFIPGLTRPSPGKLEISHGGTLILEHIEALDITLQDALLRTLMLKTSSNVGELPKPTIDIRILITSTKPLETLVRDGVLRYELLSFIGQQQLTIPPLSSLKDSLLELAFSYIGSLNLKRKHWIRSISKEVSDYISKHNWPLNLCEFEDFLYRIAKMCNSEQIEMEDIELAEFLSFETAKNISNTEVKTLNAVNTVKWNPEETLKDKERRLIMQAVKMAEGDITQAAQMLGLPVRLLEKKLEQFES